MKYVVNANIRGRRISSQEYPTKAAAQKYADATNRDRPGANARVAKVKK